MTQDEIIEMPEYLNAAYEGDDLYTGKQVRELMKLVAAAEREACAKVCEEFDVGVLVLVPCTRQKHILANAIRARGQQ